jgi:hypothetical protein
MNSLNLSRYALSACVAAVLLAGCGGSQGFTGNSAAAQPAIARQMGYSLTAMPSLVSPLLSLKGETLTATDTHRVCKAFSGNDISLTFKAFGKASGPFVGTFRVDGDAAYYFERGYRQIFLETFRIISGSRRISGSAETTDQIALNCHPATLKVATGFSLKHRQRDRGTTDVTFNNHSFSETF